MTASTRTRLCHHEDTILEHPLPLPQNPGLSGTGLVGHYLFEGYYPKPEESDKSMSYLIHTITP